MTGGIFQKNTSRKAVKKTMACGKKKSKGKGGCKK